MQKVAVALEIKALDDGARQIEGWASRPEQDRVGDIVLPKGAVYNLPLPFLLDHDHQLAVGEVDRVEVTDQGIKFWAHIKKIAEPGEVKDLCDKAWSLVKNGLRKAVSIGFSAQEYEVLPSGGLKFTKWEWLELSAVTVPAAPGALITGVKGLQPGDMLATISTESIVSEQMAASGRSEARKPPAASGEKRNPARKEKSMAKKSIADQIADWEETRRQKSAAMDDIFDEAGEGETLDAAAQESFDALEAEIEQIDGHIKRLQIRQKSAAATAVEAKADTRGVDEARSAVQVKAPKSEPGIRMARYMRSLFLAKSANRDIMSVAQEQYGQRDPGVVDMIKAAVVASNTTTDSALIGNEGGWADFVEFLRPQTILGKFGNNGIPSLTRVPFRVPLITEASESAAYWVGEGKAKPLTKASWTRTELSPLKIATIAVATMEQLRDSSPASEGLIRNSIAAAIVKRADQSFLSATAATAGVSPAGILNGITAVTTAGGDADAVRADVGAAMLSFATANNPLDSGVWIMSQARALWLSLMRNPLGQSEFATITARGGTFMGLPVIISNYVDADVIVLVNASDIYLADDGGVSVDMSTEASLQMMDNPTQDSIAATPVATDVVSLWQTNSVGFRAERTLNWMLRRPSAVAWVDSVTWGEPVVIP